MTNNHDHSKVYKLRQPLRSLTQSTETESALKEIGVMISRLMSHYWISSDDPQSRTHQLEDWLEDLREFTPTIVETACRDWRRDHPEKRPGPGHIRSLCAAERERSRRSSLSQESSLDVEEAYARSAGWASTIEFREAIRHNEERYAAAQRWRDEQAEAQAPVRGFATAASAAASLGVTVCEEPYRLIDENDPRVQHRIAEMEDQP